MILSEKLRDNFDEMVVYKDLRKTNFFSTLSLPSFMRDWLLKKFEDDDGEFDKDCKKIHSQKRRLERNKKRHSYRGQDCKILS